MDQGQMDRRRMEEQFLEGLMVKRKSHKRILSVANEKLAEITVFKIISEFM